MARHAVRWNIATVCVLAAIVGCRRISEAKRADNVRREIESYGHLELTSQTRHLPLREELSRLSAEKWTPVQMTSVRVEPKDGEAGWRFRGELLLDHNNVAVGIRAAIPLDEYSQLRRRVDAVYPTESLPPAGEALSRIRELAERYRSTTARFEAALKRPQCDFALQLTQGLLADTTIIEQAHTGGRLIFLDAIAALADDQVDPALGKARELAELSRCLGGEPHVTARVAAARTRWDALRVLEAMTRHPRAKKPHFENALRLTQWMLRTWPDEAESWRGERAIGLQVYEMARDGQILSLLDFAELVAVEKEGREAFCEAILEGVDDDELFYLNTMRRLIAPREDVYVRRREILEGVQAELRSRRKSNTLPRVAGFLLLKDLSWVNRTTARDRALTEGWTIALALALGQPSPISTPHPWTSLPFAIEERPDRVILTNVDIPGDDWAPFGDRIEVPKVTDP